MLDSVKSGLVYLYAKIEPLVLKTLNIFIESKFWTTNRVGRKVMVAIDYAFWFLPRGMVLDTHSLIKLLEYLNKISGNKFKIKIGPCVCKKSLNKRKEPMETDVLILYGMAYAKAVPGYRDITLKELKQKLVEFSRDYHLVHNVEGCCRTEGFVFVICNCDPEICVPVRIYKIWKRAIYPSPLVVEVDASKCVKCGNCVQVCPFGASIEPGKVNQAGCVGCGICLWKCEGNARRLVKRADWKKPPIIPKEWIDVVMEGASAE